MAKGDSFCSPEHFDAHQLKMSKNAFDRLMNAPLEEAPKAPLVVQAHEEVAPTEPELYPPFARFASSPLSSFPPNPPELIVNGPDLPPQGLALPVHSAEETSGILNLYSAVSFSGVVPLNWVWTPHPGGISELSVEHFLSDAEGFPQEIKRPSLELEPDFPEPDDVAASAPAGPLADVRPVAAGPAAPPAPSIEPLPPCDIALSIKPVLPVKAARLFEDDPIENSLVPFLVAPSFRERRPVPLNATAEPVPNAPALAPILDPGVVHPASTKAIQQPRRFAEAISLQIEDILAEEIQGVPEIQTTPAFVRLSVGRETSSHGWHTSSSLAAIKSRIVETRRQPMGAINFDLSKTEALLFRPEAVFAPGLDPEQIIVRQSPVSRIIMPVSREVISRNELLSGEEPSRISPVALGTPVIPARSVNTGSFVLSILETRPVGQEMIFLNPPVTAIQCGLRSVLAGFPAEEHFSAGVWQNQAPYFSLPASTSDSPVAPLSSLRSFPYLPACIRQEPAQLETPSLSNAQYRSVEWQEARPAMLPSPVPKYLIKPPALCFSAPASIACSGELPVTTALPITIFPVWATTTRVLRAEPGLPPIGSTLLPKIDASVAEVRIDVCTPSVAWDLRPSVSEEYPSLKFLPARQNPVMPSARSWPRLGSLPR